MIKFTSVLLLFLMTWTSYGQHETLGEHIVVDPNIQTEVLKHLLPLSEKKTDTLGLIYFSPILWDVYQGETLMQSSKDRDSLSNGPFKAFYLFKQDSLFIVGEFGLVSGFRYGFAARNKNKDLVCTHFFCDEIPSFKHRLEDSLDYCIAVHCPVVKLVISKLPNQNTTEPVFGYMDFTTDHFYETSSQGVVRRKSHMKIYFMARHTKID